MSEGNQPIFSNKLNQIADNMGIAMYQRFSLQEGSLFLRCTGEKLQQLTKKNEIRFLELPSGDIEFFGFQLLEYLLGCVSGGEVPTPEKPNPHKIIRIKQVVEMTGLSRTTLWRLERKGEFPLRLPLSKGSVGWRYKDIEKWIELR